MFTDLNEALLLLEEGYPLPVDVQARLLEQGIDVSELERKNTY